MILPLPPAETPVRRLPPLLLAGGAGLAVGVATSWLQRYLDSPWLALANSVGPWTIPAFVVGALMVRSRLPVAAGAVVCLAEVVGYFVTAASRGYGVGSLALFWAVFGVVGGPVFGLAGWAWSRGPVRWRAPAAAVVPAVLLIGAAYYWVALHYAGEAALLTGLAGLSIPLLARRGVPVTRILLALLPAVAAGAVGQVVLLGAYDLWTR